jgi:flagellar assembly factor FliW
MRGPASISQPGVDSPYDEQEIVVFPCGLPGFEDCKRFAVFTAEAAPFQWLTSVEGQPASFLTVDPRIVLPTFRYALSAADLSRLRATEATPLLWLAIVLVERDGTVTANLRAPIVINAAAMLGHQVMPHECLYPLRHVIYSAERGLFHALRSDGSHEGHDGHEGHQGHQGHQGHKG